MLHEEWWDLEERSPSFYILLHFAIFCLPSALLCKVLEKGGPYPQVILPQFGGYWIEDVEAPAGTPSSSESSFCEEEDGGEGLSPGGGHSYRLECNSTARAYRKHFLGKVSVFALASTSFSIQQGTFVIVFDFESLSHTLFVTSLQEHMNYYCSGSSIGNLIMSLKHEDSEGQEFLRIILR